MSKGKIKYFSSHKVEFLDRELGWHFRKLNFAAPCAILKLVQAGESCVVLIGSNQTELEILDKLSEKSVWVYLYADETFIPAINGKVVKHDAVIGVIRAYPESNSSLLASITKCLFNALRIIGRSPLRIYFKVLRNLPYGVFLIIRKYYVAKLHVKWQKKSIHLFPGYTDVFAVATLKLFHSENDVSTSLIDYALTSVESNRDMLLTFIGQSGSGWREYSLSRAREYFKEEEFNLKVNAVFMGTLGANGASNDTAQHYVRALRSSLYSLCPPGNYSYGTFRFLESLISGALPILALNCSYDSNYEVPVDISWKTISGTWDENFSRVRSLSDTERQGCLKSALAGCRRLLNSVNVQIMS